MSEYPPGKKKKRAKQERRTHGGFDELKDLLARPPSAAEPASPAETPAPQEPEGPGTPSAFDEQPRGKSFEQLGAEAAKEKAAQTERPAPKTLEEVFGNHPVPQKVRDAYEKILEKRKPKFLINLLRSLKSQKEKEKEWKKTNERKAQRKRGGEDTRERTEEPVTSVEAEAARTTESEPKGQDVVPVGKVRRFDEKGTEYVDFEDIPKMAADPESAPESVRGAEGTPKEWREKLRGLIEGAKEKVEWWKSSEEHLIRRKEELDAEAEKTGGLEGLFRSMGEKYNKLNWKTKLGVGAGLGVGAVLTGGTLAMVIPLLGIAAQRAAGLSTMYLKFEKDSHQEKWGKEKAFLKAGVYTVLMGIAIKEAIEYASETELAHAAQAKVEGWLGSMLGHDAAPTVISGASEATPSPAGTEVPTPAPEELQKAYDQAKQAVIEGRAGLAEPLGTMPEISVEAVRGKGYEFMMKRLWEQLQERGLNPRDYPEGSDFRRLLETDAGEIDKVVHQIAADPSHGFFNADGTSIQINLGDKMSIDTDGNIRLNDVIKAPAGAPVTGVYSAEQVADVRPTIESPVQGFGEEARLETAEPQQAVSEQFPASGFPGEQLVPAPEVSMPAEAVSPAAEAPAVPLPTETIPAQEPIPTVDLTQSEEITSVPSMPESLPPQTIMPEYAKEFVNSNKVSIDPLRGQVFGDASDALYAYGNNFADRLNAAQEFAQNNPDATVYVQSEKPILQNGVWRPFVFEVRSVRGFLGFGHSVQIIGVDGPMDDAHIGAIDPMKFTKQLDK